MYASSPQLLELQSYQELRDSHRSLWLTQDCGKGSTGSGKEGMNIGHEEQGVQERNVKKEKERERKIKGNE